MFGHELHLAVHDNSCNFDPKFNRILPNSKCLKINECFTIYHGLYIHKRFTKKGCIYANETNAIYINHTTVTYRGSSLHVRTEQIMPREEIIQVNANHRPYGNHMRPCVQRCKCNGKEKV
jgi:hypothetical protein